VGKRTRNFAFVSLCYGRSGEEICTGYAMASSGRMQYDYKQTNGSLGEYRLKECNVINGPDGPGLG